MQIMDSTRIRQLVTEIGDLPPMWIRTDDHEIYMLTIVNQQPNLLPVALDGMIETPYNLDELQDSPVFHLVTLLLNQHKAVQANPQAAPEFNAPTLSQETLSQEAMSPDDLFPDDQSPEAPSREAALSCKETSKEPDNEHAATPNVMQCLWINYQKTEKQLTDLINAYKQLEPLNIILKQGTYHISVCDGHAVIKLTNDPGIPYGRVAETPQAQILLKARLLEGLKKSVEQVSTHKVSQVICKLNESLKCWPAQWVRIPVKKHKTHLWIHGGNRCLIFRGRQFHVTDQGITTLAGAVEPAEFSSCTYKELDPQKKQAFVVFFNYLYLNPQPE